MEVKLTTSLTNIDLEVDVKMKVKLSKAQLNFYLFLCGNRKHLY